MPFPRKLLNEGEDIVIDVHPHWWFLSGPVVALIVVTAGAVALNVVVDNSMVAWASIAVIGVVLLWFVVRWLQWLTTNFVLTTDRLIYRHGVLGKHGREIPLERVNDISVNQTLFERLIRAGDVLIESGGERGQQLLTDIPKPFLVQNAIYTEIERAADRDAQRIAGRPQLSVPEQIEKLDELRQRGVISQAEFDAKKAQLLDRM